MRKDDVLDAYRYGTFAERQKEQDELVDRHMGEKLAQDFKKIFGTTFRRAKDSKGKGKAR